MKIVLDTNVLVSGIFWRGTPREILFFWVEGKFEIIASKSILEEYRTVIHRIDPNSEVSDRWFIFILEKCYIVPNHQIKRISRDSDDDKFINCSIVGNADYLVSGDSDLTQLSKSNDLPITILTPAEFLRRLKA